MHVWRRARLAYATKNVVMEVQYGLCACARFVTSSLEKQVPTFVSFASEGALLDI